MVQRAIQKSKELAAQQAAAESEALARGNQASKMSVDSTVFGAQSGHGEALDSLATTPSSRGGSKRILVYSHSLPPWVDGVSFRYTAHMKMLKEAGHTVTAVTIEEKLDSAVTDSCAKTHFVDSTCLYWYPAKRFPDLTLRNLARVWRACVESRAEVIHATMCPSLPLFFICARALNIPLVIAIHTDSVTLLEKCGQPAWTVATCKMLEPLGTWFADATYTVSPSYGAILLSRGCRCLDVTWGGYANTSVFNPEVSKGDWRNTLSFGHPEDFIIITAGRVSPEKDIGFLVELVASFRARGLRVWLGIIGDGPAAADFAPLHGDDDATGVWFIPGFLGQRELASVYRAADVVCSASTFETFGFTALEAMACGTPFLGPRAQGFRDVVSHGKGGYLFDAHDQTSAAHYLELMVHENAELFPEAGVIASTADFTAKNCLKRTLLAYDETIRRRNASSARFGCGPGSNPLRKAIMSAVRALPSLIMLFFMALNWVLLNLPLAFVAAQKWWAQARRTAGATWDRRMRYTNLTRNRVLVGSQVTS